MAALSERRFIAYAKGQIRAMDTILIGHTVRELMCSCGRVVPCSVAVTISRRRFHYIRALARLDPEPAIGRAKVGVRDSGVPVAEVDGFGEGAAGTRYCADMRTRVLHGPEDYFRVDPEYRLWFWEQDLNEAVSRLNLVPAPGLVVGG